MAKWLIYLKNGDMTYDKINQRFLLRFASVTNMVCLY